MMLNRRPCDCKDLMGTYLSFTLLGLFIYKSYVMCKVVLVKCKDSNCWTLDLHTLKVKGSALGWCALMTGNVWADDQDFSRPGSTPPCRPWSVLSSQWNLVVFLLSTRLVTFVGVQALLVRLSILFHLASTAPLFWTQQGRRQIPWWCCIWLSPCHPS